MEDKRAHQRIDNIEVALAESTVLTKQIAENTAEIVSIVRGAKNLRAFAVWVLPLVALSAAIASAWAGYVAWFRGH